MKRKYNETKCDVSLSNEGITKIKRENFCINKKDIYINKDIFYVITSYLTYKDIRHFDIIFKGHEFLEIVKNRREKCIEILYSKLPTICINVINSDVKKRKCKKIKTVPIISESSILFSGIAKCKCGDEHLNNLGDYKSHNLFMNNKEEMIIVMKDNYLTCMSTILGCTKSRYKTSFNNLLMEFDLFDFCGFISSKIDRIQYLKIDDHYIPNNSDNIENLYNTYLHKDVVKERLELNIKGFN